MYPALPDSCYLSPPAEITSELAVAFADKMNLLLKAQLLGKSVSDLESAFRLLMELSNDLVSNDSVFLFWREETDEAFSLKQTLGFKGVVPTPLLLDIIAANGKAETPSPLAISTSAPIPQRYGQVLLDLSASGLLSMPLYLGERVAGVIMMLRGKGRRFEPNEAHLLRVFLLSFEGVLESLCHNGETRTMTFQDGLTGLFSERYYEQQIEREMDRARRTNEPVSMLMLNIEGFNALKERCGHAACEALIREVSKALKRVCRKSDTLARFHEDNFAMIMPRTGKESLGMVANRIFSSLDNLAMGKELSLEGKDAAFNLSAAAYPQDASTAEGAILVCCDGLIKASRMAGKRFYHPPVPVSKESKGELLDMTRVGLFREPLHDHSRILQLFVRLCLDSVPADRVSIVVPRGDELMAQAAYGFEGLPDMSPSMRIPMDQKSISSFVAQKREPLLVSHSGEAQGLPINNGSAYTSASFFSYPLTWDNEFLGIINFSNHSEGRSFTREDVENFAPLAEKISQYLAIDNRYGSLQKEFLRDSLFALIDFMENQQAGMRNHSREVATLAKATAEKLGYSKEKAEVVWLSSRLHDLGKVSFRGNVLSQSRPLSSQERALTQRHPLLGWKFLEEVPLHNIDRDAILLHHEREDGSGYLRKQGDSIPEAAKILAVADVFQALCSHRPYRPAVSKEKALGYLEANKGVLFAGAIVDALKAVVAGV